MNLGLGNINTQSIVVQSGKMLSELHGAHDAGDYVLEVQSVSPNSPLLNRGDIVCMKDDNTVTLAGSEGTGPDQVFGICLEYQVDPAGIEPTASIARNGVWNAPALTLTPGEDIRAYEIKMRERGLFLEKINHWAQSTQPPLP